MDTTFLIMAASIGPRFERVIKQLEPVDASGHIIMDYSIRDAIEADFNHVVFVIRKDIEAELREVIGKCIASVCAVHEYLVSGGAVCMAGFVLKNTLSDNGGMTPSICKMPRALRPKILSKLNMAQKPTGFR